MDKNTSKIYLGQPILSQVIKLIPKKIVTDAVKQHNANYYYKALPFRVHMISLLYGVLSFCNGLREICEGMLACQGKVAHLGMNKAPARSTLSDANNKRSYRILETIYFSLVRHYISFISDSRLKGLSIRNLKIIDSTTIRLFSEILRGVGRNPKDGSRKKGGFKVHSLMDAFSGIVEFLRITAAREHDRKFLYHISMKANSWIVFDKAYIYFRQFAKWTENKIWFVTRMKSNAVFHVTKVIQDNTRRKKYTGVLQEQYITIGYKDGEQNEQRLKLRRIVFKAEDGQIYEFMTNNFLLPATQIAQIYKYRWMIELLFKQIKQNFPLKYFWGESENAIKMQVFSVLIAQLLMVVIRKISETKKSFSNMITVVRLHLMSYVNLKEFIHDAYKAWNKTHPPGLMLDI
jgi:hypothetical protein